MWSQTTVLHHSGCLRLYLGCGDSEDAARNGLARHNVEAQHCQPEDFSHLNPPVFYELTKLDSDLTAAGDKQTQQLVLFLYFS